MKKNRSYVFVLDGKFNECDSLVEIKSELGDKKWEELIMQTSDYYAQLYAVNKSKSTTIKLDLHDIRLMRSLKRALNLIRDLDPIGYFNASVDEKTEKYTETINQELSLLQAGTIKIASGSKLDGNSDIIVSNI